MSRIDEIRQKMSPEQWLQGLRANRAAYEEQLINLMTDRDVIEAAGMRPEDILVRVDAQILELDARIQEIDERLGAAKDGALGLSRAERRRLQRSKNGKKEAIHEESTKAL